MAQSRLLLVVSLLSMSLGSALLHGCAESSSDAPLPSLEGEGFFDQPWPSDLRTDGQGHADLQGFPGQSQVDLLVTYSALAETIEGFGNNSPIYFRFLDPIDLTLLPDPASSTLADSPVKLLNIDPLSTGYGSLTPIRWDYRSSADLYEPQDLLAIAPVFGFPLLPATTYAALVQEPLARATEEFQAHFSDEDPDSEHWRPLQETLFTLGIDESTVANATIFTTQDPTRETAEYADFIQNRLSLPPLTGPLERIDQLNNFRVYEGRVWLPVWQEGERPYSSEGGGLHRNAVGEPSVWEWEYVPFSLTIPLGFEQPAKGWPLVLASHGTGGDYLSHVYPGTGTTPANMLARRGVAMLGIDQPLSGMRATPDTIVDLHTFNFLNPASARAVLRQSALDFIYLARVLGQGPVELQVRGEQEILLDTSLMSFHGHSQGGLTGALAGPWLGNELRSLFLSGAGGGLSVTIVERKQGFDAQALLADILGVETADVDTFHPVVGLLQWIVDVTDTINYGPYWFKTEPNWQGSPLHVFMTEGLLDEYTPPRTAESLAASARLPFLYPVGQSSEAQDLRGLEPVIPPASANCRAWDDQGMTCGLAQYPKDGHFAIYDNPDACTASVDFIVSSLEQQLPTIPE